mgnify:CR=1 FL=1
MLIPLKREISEEEYPAVARMVAKEIGIDLFDDTTYEASRLMYWPSTSANGEFFLQRCRTAQSLTRMNTFLVTTIGTTPPPGQFSSRQSEAVQHSIAQQADPLTKAGCGGVLSAVPIPWRKSSMPFSRKYMRRLR